MKYGAEMVESSVKTISKPVIDRLPVNQIDEFACRQLDKVSFPHFFCSWVDTGSVPLCACVGLSGLASLSLFAQSPLFSHVKMSLFAGSYSMGDPFTIDVSR